MKTIHLPKEILKSFKTLSKMTMKNYSFSQGIFLKHREMYIELSLIAPHYFTVVKIGKFKEPMNLDVFLPQDTLKIISNSITSKDPRMVELNIYENGIKVGLEKLKGESLRCWEKEQYPDLERGLRMMDSYRHWKTLEWKNKDQLFNLFAEELYTWDLKNGDGVSKTACFNVKFLINLVNFLCEVAKKEEVALDFYYKDYIGSDRCRAVKVRVGDNFGWLMAVRL